MHINLSLTRSLILEIGGVWWNGITEYLSLYEMGEGEKFELICDEVKRCWEHHYVTNE